MELCQLATLQSKGKHSKLKNILQYAAEEKVFIQILPYT
jgi:hypothetical protein